MHCYPHAPGSILLAVDRLKPGGDVQLVELKNGETFNGHLFNCDSWMNIHLKKVICTSKVSPKNINSLQRR